MKICGIICEYNPFHNGHAYLIDRAKKQSGCDAIVCIMSGCFTQRGELAILDRYTRAKHAILAGADAVIELPAIFATAPAEIFAKGAVKILNSIPAFSTLAFGCETADKEAFFQAAKNIATESNTFKNVLRQYLKIGFSFTKARSEALVKSCGTESLQFISSPNNILGIEYLKALLTFESQAEILPIERIGADYTDAKLYKNFSSATAIRKAVYEEKIRLVRKNIPEFVLKDLQNAVKPDLYKKIALYSVIRADASELKKILDCTEGLENRLKAFAKSTHDYDEFVKKVTTKRYISSRIRRILAASVLGINEDLVRKGLKNPLYMKILAINKQHADSILPVLKQSDFPCITRRSDLSLLSKTASDILAVDTLAADIFNLTADHNFTESQLRLIDSSSAF